MRQILPLHALCAALLLLASTATAQTFTKVTTGPPVLSMKSSSSASWIDYDNDGHVDLFATGTAGATSDLYRNNGDGTFTLLSIPLTSQANNAGNTSWGDFNDDGLLDVFIPNLNGPNRLWRNDGSDVFTEITGTQVNIEDDFRHGDWADYDNDGDLDLAATRREGLNNRLWRNDNGLFSFVDNIISNDGGNSTGVSWVDFDNDGDSDLFITNLAADNFFYENNGDGTFTKLASSPLANNIVVTGASSASWGDYDNDRDLDVFIAFNDDVDNQLFRNDNGTFTEVTSGSWINDGGDSQGATWGDADNDGDLDLFVANTFGGDNFLYLNNNGASFTKVTTGDIVNDGGSTGAPAFGDYDEDGFLDLYAPNVLGESNFLYNNDGNANNWLKVKLIGSISNRFGVGARVSVKALITGQSLSAQARLAGGQTWQMRHVGNGATAGQNAVGLPHFGLGDATTATKVKVEWPSGVVTVLNNVAANQTLIIIEETFALTLKRVFIKPNGKKKAVLKWETSDVSTNKIDFYIDRAPDGTPDERTSNDGKHKLTIPFPGDGPFEIQACEKDATTICSNLVLADFTNAPISNETDTDDAETLTSHRLQENLPGIALLGNYPNPFNPATTIAYDLSEAAHITVAIYDMLGRRVRTLISGTLSEGRYTAVWDGQDAAGKPVASGLYLYRIEGHTATATFSQTGRMLLGK